jgi:hypothetical protein
MSWLLLMTPEADPLVDQWRMKHDWSAQYGVSAHVTVRTPFLEPADWSELPDAALQALIPLKGVRLARLEDRPGGLVVLIEPDEQLPPHQPAFARPRYHITVMRTQDPDARRRASEAIARHLPMEVTGTELWATSGSQEAGLVRSVFAAST